MSNATAPAPRQVALIGLALAILVGLGVVAASWSSGGSPTTPAAEPDASASTDPSAPTTAPGDPADQVVWQERTSGGLPISVGAAEVPTLTVYADGRVFLAVRDANTRYDHPVPMRAGQVTEARLARFLRDVADSRLFGPEQDFGRPEVTDLPTTSVSAHLGDATAAIDVYALEASFEEDLSDAQVDARNTLRTLIAAGRTLAEDAEAWTPDRVRVTDVGPLSTDPGPVADAAAWPGPPFDTFAEVPGGGGQRCLVVDGAAAAEVFDAASRNPTTAFASGEEVHELLVAVLLPAEPGCPTEPGS